MSDYQLLGAEGKEFTFAQSLPRWEHVTADSESKHTQQGSERKEGTLGGELCANPGLVLWPGTGCPMHPSKLCYCAKS